MNMISKISASALLALGLLLGTQNAALAEGNLTIVATPAQLESMNVLLGDLKDEHVDVKVLNPADAGQAKNDDFVLMVLTAQPADPLYSGEVGAQLSETDKKRIGAAGGKKLIMLRDVWKNGQEIVIFAGNSDEDAKAVRMETKDRWWEIVGSWFDIFTGGMKGY